MTEEITCYDDAVSYLNSTPRFTEKHSIAQTAQMLLYLGSPETSFRIIHTAGSNGKGSVCAALASVLRCAGYSCGLFTSPHLVTVRERFVVDGDPVTEEQFLEDFLDIRGMLRDHPECSHPTYFEYLFLMAMIRFRKAGVQAAVLETGLGGRLDATNAVARPDVCVITSVSLEHTEYLGSSIPQIAAEKAGIIKPGVPVVYDASDPEAAQVIQAAAQDLQAPAFPVYPQQIRNAVMSRSGIRFGFSGEYDLYDLQVASKAPYQQMNMALAVCAAEQFLSRTDDPQEADAARKRRLYNDPYRTAAIEAGIARCSFPGRMEEKENGLILDGAHNPAGIEAFLNSVRGMTEGKQILLFACMQDKNYTEMLRSIAVSGLFELIIFTGLDSGRAADPHKLSAMLKAGAGEQVLCIPQPREALQKAREVRKKGQYIFAAGSLYLVGMLESAL